MGSCRPVDWAFAPYPLFTESLVQVLSDNAKKMGWSILHGPCVVDEEANVPRVPVDHSPKPDGLLHLLVP
jgi:hypothetical protein